MELLQQHFDTAFAAPDGIVKLRELILTLAMQGKLVKQDPSDPPASELLKKIEAEKQRLVKAGKIKQPKALPEITPEEVPFGLPQGWEWVRLGNIGLVGSSSRVHQRDWRDDGVPFYRAREIVKLSNLGFVENELFISEEHYQSLAKDGLTPEVNDLMITGVGTIGVPYIVRETDRFYFKDASVLIFKNLHRLYAPFLFRFFKSPFWVERIHDGSMGTTVHTLTIGRANEILVPLPPLPEQQRIVTKIDQLMARCDELEKLRTDREQQRLAVHTAAIRQLLDGSSSFPRRRESSRAEELDPRLRGGDENGRRDDGVSVNAWDFIRQHFGELYSVKENVAELRKAILQLAVMGKLVPQDPNDPPARELLEEIEAEKQRLVKARKIKTPKPLPSIKPDEVPYPLPQGWECVRFGDLTTEIATGPFGSMIHKSDYVLGGIPLINPSHMIDGNIVLDPSISVSRKMAIKLASYKLFENDIVMARRGEMGRCAIVTAESDGFLCGTGSFVLRFIDKINRQYILNIFKTENVREYLGGNSVGTTMTNLNHNILNNIPVLLPPLPEQQRIVVRVDQLMALCDTLEQQIDAATGKQTELLNAMMSHTHEANAA